MRQNKLHGSFYCRLTQKMQLQVKMDGTRCREPSESTEEANSFAGFQSNSSGAFVWVYPLSSTLKCSLIVSGCGWDCCSFRKSWYLNVAMISVPIVSYSAYTSQCWPTFTLGKMILLLVNLIPFYFYLFHCHVSSIWPQEAENKKTFLNDREWRVLSQASHAHHCLFFYDGVLKSP